MLQTPVGPRELVRPEESGACVMRAGAAVRAALLRLLPRVWHGAGGAAPGQYRPALQVTGSTGALDLPTAVRALESGFSRLARAAYPTRLPDSGARLLLIGPCRLPHPTT